MADAPYAEIPRVDARDKVTGSVRYGADDARPEMAHAIFAVSQVAVGTIAALDTAAAAAVPGVRLILTHENVGPLQPVQSLFGNGHSFQSVQPLMSPEVHYRGEPIALVAADTLEAAAHAALLVRATYEERPFAAAMGSEGAVAVPQAEAPLPPPVAADVVAGEDAAGAFAAAAVQVDATYRSAPNHQNPIELISTVAEWEGGRLTIHEGTQNAQGVKFGVATMLGLDPESVDVISSSVGGGFGQKNSLQMQTALVAIAARELGRPVKMVVPRKQLFHAASFRAATLQRIRLGADADGRMVAALHDADAQTSRADFFPGEYTNLSARLHGVPNFQGFHRLIQVDTQNPGYMRCPFEHLAAFAMESAVDELATALGQDPVALRLANDTQADPVTGLPLSSRFVAECLTQGAERFGWADRSPEPGSMVAENGDQIGWGVATGAYPCVTVPAITQLSADDAGGVTLRVGAHEMGQGIRTALSAALSRRLGVAVADIALVLGDTRVAPQHLTAGAWGTATAVPAAQAAADALLAALADLGAGPVAGRTPAEVLRAAGRADLEVEVTTLAPGQPPEVLDRLRTGLLAPGGPVYPEFVTYSYIAHFVEVRVEPTTRRVRVPRVVTVADCGRVMSPRTARSQAIGGIVWGIGATLREASEVDPRYGGWLNADIAEYAIPVNADIGTIEVGFVDRPDPRLNAAGLKSLGEVVMSGVAPAIANAVFHATGRRLRDLPIRLEALV